MSTEPLKISDSKNTIIVTGASGLIGQAVVSLFHNDEHTVYAIIRNPSHLYANVTCHNVTCDLLHDAALSVLEDLQPDIIIHCAAMLPTRFEDSAEVAKLNSQIDEKIILFCRQLNCRLIYISGTSLYGLSDQLYSEKDKVYPTGDYLSAKYKSEQLALDVLQQNVVILRVSAPYGSAQRSRTVLRIFIENAVNGLDIFYDGSGARQQAFLAAYDVAQAIIRVVSRKNISGIFNIANDQPISMRELAELTVRTISASKSKVFSSGKIDPQENHRSFFDISKAKALLDWTPSITLEKGISMWASYLLGEK